MTIPIRPGPFSFLAQFGQAGGEAFDAAHKEEDKLKKEAQNRLNMMITLRSKGLIKPDAFSTPEAMQIYNRLGITPVSDQPNAEDFVNFTKAQFSRENAPATPVNIPNSILQGAGSALMPPAMVPAQGPDAVSDARRMVAGLPTRAAVGIVERQGNVLQTGTELQKDQLAGVTDPLTLQTEVESKRDTLYNALATRSVSAIVGRSGQDILDLNSKTVSDDAWRLAEADAKSKGYVVNEELTRPYIDAAILAAQQEARKLAIARTAAENRGGYGADQQAAMLRILQGQQTRITADINAMEKLSRTDELAADGVTQALSVTQDPTKRQSLYDAMPQWRKSAYEKVRSWKQRRQALEDESNGIRDQLNNVLPNAGGAIPTRGGTRLPPAKIESWAQMLRSKKATIEQLQEALRQGAITQADYDLVVRRSGGTTQ